jgi:hypothetical protein
VASGLIDRPGNTTGCPSTRRTSASIATIASVSRNSTTGTSTASRRTRQYASHPDLAFPSTCGVISFFFSSKVRTTRPCTVPSAPRCTRCATAPGPAFTSAVRTSW